MWLDNTSEINILFYKSFDVILKLLILWLWTPNLPLTRVYMVVGDDEIKFAFDSYDKGFIIKSWDVNFEMCCKCHIIWRKIQRYG